MFERFTEAAIQSIVAARSAALAEKATTISTEHLLYGLLTAAPAVVMRGLRVGSGLHGLRDGLQTPHVLDDTQLKTGDVPFGVLVKVVFERAVAEADSQGHRPIAPEHLLTGLFIQQGTRAQALLEEVGFDRGLLESEPESRTLENNDEL